MFQSGGAWSFVWGGYAPRGDGTGSTEKN